MINLYSNGLTSFKVEDSVLPRMFEIRYSGSKIVLRNILSGALVYLDIIDNILIDGLAADISTLRELIYNYSCSCGPDDGVKPEFKIFDYTFDYTFE